MNKSELISVVATDASLTKAQAEAAVNAVLDNITKSVASADKVTLIGFGSFEVRNRQAREGRNPKTGETMQIPASKSPAFTAGKKFKEAVQK